jgi:hypothetical protein
MLRLAVLMGVNLLRYGRIKAACGALRVGSAEP